LALAGKRTHFVLAEFSVSGTLSCLLMHLFRDKRKDTGEEEIASLFLSNITSTEAHSDFSPCHVPLARPRLSYLPELCRTKFW